MPRKPGRQERGIYSASFTHSLPQLCDKPTVSFNAGAQRRWGRKENTISYPKGVEEFSPGSAQRHPGVLDMVMS